MKQIRKAIFVREDIFKKFKEAAKKDGRKYSAYLEKLLKNICT